MKFLIVKTSSLGDIVQSFPVLEYLKQKSPDCTIDWVVENPFQEIVKAHPYVRKAIVISSRKWRKGQDLKGLLSSFGDLRKDRYEAVLDLQGNIKSGLVTSFAKSGCKIGYGRKTAPESPNIVFTNKRIDPLPGLNIREEYLALAKAYFEDKKEFSPQGFLLTLSEQEEETVADVCKGIFEKTSFPILVAPGSAWKNKQLGEEVFAAFLKKVQKRLQAYFVFTWGSEGEKLMAEQLQRQLANTSEVLDKLSLSALQHVMKQAKLVIAMDSLPLHLAGACKAPTFSVFGPSLAAKYRPLGENQHAFQGGCPYGRIFDKRCPILRSCKTGLCMKGLSADDLFDAFVSQSSSTGF